MERPRTYSYPRWLALAVSLIWLQTGADAREITVRSAKLFAGRHPELGLEFSSELRDGGAVLVQVRMPAVRARIEISLKPRYVTARSASVSTGEPTGFTAKELANLKELSNWLESIDSFPSTRVEVSFARAVDYLLNYPAGVVVDVDTRRVRNKKEAGVIPEEYTSLCGNIGQLVTGTYDLRWDGGGNPVSESVTLGPCGEAPCLGRCGGGCESPPHPSIQRFTQECLNHDLCCRAIGGGSLCFLPVGPCGDEWQAAAEGFFFSPDCSAIAGTWQMSLTGISCLPGSGCGSIGGDLGSFSYSSEGRRFWGLQQLIDGRYEVFVGSRTAPTDWAGQWGIPTYMGEECGSVFGGFAAGTMTGKGLECRNQVTMTLAMTGIWPWYNADTCTPVGPGSFSGQSIGSKGAMAPATGLQEKRVGPRRGLVPGLLGPRKP